MNGTYRLFRRQSDGSEVFVGEFAYEYTPKYDSRNLKGELAKAARRIRSIERADAAKMRNIRYDLAMRDAAAAEMNDACESAFEDLADAAQEGGNEL